MASDEVKKAISEVLKNADNFIRRGELDQAESCVTKAKQIDPTNIYAYAFQERIDSLKDKAHRHIVSTSLYEVSDNFEQNDGGIVQMMKNIRPEDQSKQQSESQRTLYPISREQLLAAARNFAQPEFKPTSVYLSEKPSFLSHENCVLPNVSVEQSISSPKSQSGGPEQSDEARELKIQRIIKAALQSARKQIEQDKTETRSYQQGGSSEMERMKIQDLVKSSRAGSEQGTSELREVLEGDLQQRIRDAIQRKSKSNAIEGSVGPVSNAPSQESELDGQEFAPPHTEPEPNTDRLETLERYKLVLSSVWADGAATQEEIATLEQLRQLLSVSHEEHDRIEKEVQLDTYVEAFKRAWNSGKISPKDVSILAELRERFKISMEKHLAIESRILWEIQPEKTRPTILVVDDDEHLLEVVAKTLNDAGYFTAPFSTSDEAYAYLLESSPDLILCDVNLRTSTMGGFAFYEKVRELQQTREIPFIFLSGLTDETLVRTGKELGVDDYLSKPVSEEILLATIRGKLRRYQELRDRSN